MKNQMERQNAMNDNSQKEDSTMMTLNTQPCSSVDQTMGTQTRYSGIPIVNTMGLPCTPSSPIVDDAERLIELSKRNAKQPGQVARRAVLAPRWSDKHGTVMLVDVLTGEVKAAWRPKSPTRG